MSKMRCPSCGRKVDNSDNFCRNCGTPLHQRGIPTIGDNGYYDGEPEEPRRNYGPRIAAIVIVLLAIIGGSAWWWIDSTNREQAAEELRRQQALDSIEAAEAAQAARNAARDDSLRRDSLARTALTPDLALFELRGAVESVVSRLSADDSCVPYLRRLFNGRTIIFDNSGRWVNRDLNFGSFDEPLMADVTSDSGNRVNTIRLGDNTYSIFFTGDYPTRVSFLGAGTNGADDIAMANGNASGIAVTRAAGDNEKKCAVKISYAAFDERGNWTHRVMTIGTDANDAVKISETRTINYR